MTKSKDGKTLKEISDEDNKKKSAGITAKPKVKKETVLKPDTRHLPHGWDKVQEEIDSGKSEWVKYVDGRVVVQVLDWDFKTWIETLRKDRPPEKDYLITNRGNLDCGSKRLKRQLLPFAKERYSGNLIIDREGKGIETQYYVTEMR